MKKLITTILFVLALVCGINYAPNNAEASDVWVCGDYPIDVYVRDESVRWDNPYRAYATVIFVDKKYKSSRIYHNAYSHQDGRWWYRDMNGHSKTWSYVDNAVQESVLNHLLTLR